MSKPELHTVYNAAEYDGRFEMHGVDGNAIRKKLEELDDHTFEHPINRDLRGQLGEMSYANPGKSINAAIAKAAKILRIDKTKIKVASYLRHHLKQKTPKS